MQYKCIKYAYICECSSISFSSFLLDIKLEKDCSCLTTDIRTCYNKQNPKSENYGSSEISSQASLASSCENTPKSFNARQEA